MRRSSWRAFGYNALSVLAGASLLFGGVLLIEGITDDTLYCEPWRRGLGIAISAALAAVSLTVVIAVRRRRERWLRSSAIYETFDAFAALARQRKGVVLQLGWMFVVGAAAHGLVRAQLFGANQAMTIRECYEQIQKARRRGAISEGQLRAAIDELFEETVSRHRASPGAR